MDDPEPEKTLEQGCATTIVAALDPSLAAMSGAFLKDCVVATDTLKDFARDEQKGGRALGSERGADRGEVPLETLN